MKLFPLGLILASCYGFQSASDAPAQAVPSKSYLDSASFVVALTNDIITTKPERSAR